MKTFKIVLLLCWLVFVLAMVCSCDKVYLPADYAVALDQRIIELQTDVADSSGDCKVMLQQDLEFLTTLKEASE